MELRDFIQQTLEQIVLGVKASHKVILDNQGTVGIAPKPGPSQTEVQFDIAVTARRSAATSNVDRVEVVSMVVNEEESHASELGSISRIRFKVWVALPVGFR